MSVATFVNSSLTSPLFLLFQGSRGGQLAMILESSSIAFEVLPFGFLSFYLIPLGLCRRRSLLLRQSHL